MHAFMSSKPRQHYLCVSPYHATADALDVDAQEYLQRHSIQGLLGAKNAC